MKYRSLMILLAVVVTVFLETVLVAQDFYAEAESISSFYEQDAQYLSGMASRVIDMVNTERAKYGLEPLYEDARLNAAASVRAREIVQKFSHTRPDGTRWSTISAAAKGENIARGQLSAERVMAAWMSSQGHRKNILRESFGSIGVCVLKVDGVIHWVQMFGK